MVHFIQDSFLINRDKMWIVILLSNMCACIHFSADFRYQHRCTLNFVSDSV